MWLATVFRVLIPDSRQQLKTLRYRDTDTLIPAYAAVAYRDAGVFCNSKVS